MNRHKALALLLALCMLLLLPACGGEDTYTLRTCLPEVPSTLDPAMVTTQTEQIVVSHLFENLMKRTSDGSGGYNIDPIKWRVLSNADGKLFLLSDRNLDAKLNIPFAKCTLFADQVHPFR